MPTSNSFLRQHSLVLSLVEKDTGETNHQHRGHRVPQLLFPVGQQKPNSARGVASIFRGSLLAKPGLDPKVPEGQFKVLPGLTGIASTTACSECLVRNSWAPPPSTPISMVRGRGRHRCFQIQMKAAQNCISTSGQTEPC